VIEMVERRHVADAPETDPIPVQSAEPPVQTHGRHEPTTTAEPVPHDSTTYDPTTPETTRHEPTSRGLTHASTTHDRTHEPVTGPAPVAVRRTRISGLWVGVTVAAVVLLVLLVFIIQNGQSVLISFFGASLRLPLGVALLLAAIAGVLLVAIPGYGRIYQLRRAVKRAGKL
jgi:uncharacterized integral membrane protein